MTDDLVSRLRKKWLGQDIWSLCEEAARRIEALEAEKLSHNEIIMERNNHIDAMRKALWRICEIDAHRSEQSTSPEPGLYAQIARNALDGKHE